MWKQIINGINLFKLHHKKSFSQFCHVLGWVRDPRRDTPFGEWIDGLLLSCFTVIISKQHVLL